MFVTGLGTAVPPRRYTQAECWEAFKFSSFATRLDRSACALIEQVLLGDNGIATRHLAPENLREVFEIDADTLHRRFGDHAPRLAIAAARQALENAGRRAPEIDAVIASTCTGYLCPGLTSYLIEGLGLRQNALAFDLVGQGCGAALPNWMMAEALLAAGRCRNVLAVSAEVCSAAIYLDNDPGVLISGCLFGDGAGAAVLSDAAAQGRRRIEWKTSASLTDPARRDDLRFEQRQGMLRNILTRPVPKLAAAYAERVLGTVLEASCMNKQNISTWIWHAGGRDVLAALKERLELPEEAILHSREALSEFGNLSSAFVYFVLSAALKHSAPPGWWWMSSFGAGFSCHGALLEVSACE